MIYTMIHILRFKRTLYHVENVKSITLLFKAVVRLSVTLCYLIHDNFFYGNWSLYQSLYIVEQIIQ